MRHTGWRFAVPAVLTALLVGGLPSFAGPLPPARAGDVLFTMPGGWSRTDAEDGTVTLTAPGSPRGQWFQIRLLPQAPLKGTLAQHYAGAVGELRKKVTITKEHPAAFSKNQNGEDQALGLLAWPNPQAAGGTVACVLIMTQVGQKVQPFMLITNDAGLYTKHNAAAARCIEGAQFASRIVLAPGARPLTLGLVNQVIDHVEWLLEVPMTIPQRQKLQEILVKSWKEAKPGDLDVMDEFAKVRAQLAAMPAIRREGARQAMQPEFVAGLRKGDDDYSKLLAGIYDAGHRPIAAGQPPLTKQKAYAVIELKYFMASQVAGGETIRPTQNVKDDWAKMMAADYAGTDAKGRELIGKIPEFWGILAYAWPELPAADREKFRKEWAAIPQIKELADHLASLRTEAAASAAASHGGTDTAAALRKIQEDGRRHQFLSNMLQMEHQSRMQIINNIGGNHTIYQYRYR